MREQPKDLEESLTPDQMDSLVAYDRVEMIYGGDVTMVLVDNKVLYELKDDLYKQIPVGGYLEVQD